MNTLLLATILVTIIAEFVTCQGVNEEPNVVKVLVDVYYEALCPDSKTFFNEQLHPNMNLINKYVGLTLIPFGHAKHTLVDNMWVSECRHSATECQGHKIQACALVEPVSHLVLFEYISCLMMKGEKEKPYPGQECADQLEKSSYYLNYSSVEECAQSTEVENKLEVLQNTTKALMPPLKYVPTIVFNKVFKQVDLDLAVKDFKKALCNYIQAGSKQVPECSSLVKATHGHAAGNTLPSTLLLSAVTAIVVSYL